MVVRLGLCFNFASSNPLNPDNGQKIILDVSAIWYDWAVRWRTQTKHQYGMEWWNIVWISIITGYTGFTMQNIQKFCHQVFVSVYASSYIEGRRISLNNFPIESTLPASNCWREDPAIVNCSGSHYIYKIERFNLQTFHRKSPIASIHTARVLLPNDNFHFAVPAFTTDLKTKLQLSNKMPLQWLWLKCYRKTRKTDEIQCRQCRKTQYVLRI